MTPQTKPKDLEDKLTQLIREGCIIDTAVGLIPLAAVKVTPTHIGWVGMFPEAQNDVHTVQYATARIIHGRDVGFYDDNGELIIYAAPYTEWHNIHPDDFRTTQSAWHTHLADTDHAKRFKGFFITQVEEQLHGETV